ncbi:heterokaryon incompatibility protein-domain-containing protein [Hypoxylon fuscum]|nr:heterokaryon incompatibility protein-domain-containing protein [Hypoxylon fuscum]
MIKRNTYHLILLKRGLVLISYHYHVECASACHSPKLPRHQCYTDNNSINNAIDTMLSPGFNYQLLLSGVGIFTYDLPKPLPSSHIRLLKPIVLRQDLLSYQLVHFPRNQAPQYTAVSYTWGTEDKSKFILLNDREFRVRPNLWQCLYHLGRASRDAPWNYLWVDAICIDQGSFKDKNLQVFVMDQTYTAALCVSVWLGLPPPEQSNLQSPSDGDSILLVTAQRNPFDSPNCLAKLANHSYWSRRWIVQEFLLGRTVWIHCGDFWIDSQHFHFILREKVGTESIVNSILPSSSGFWKNLTYKTNPWLRGISFEHVPAAAILVSREWDETRYFRHSLYHLIKEHYRTSNCSDVRDKVFALLSLVHHLERQLLDDFFPDYSMAEDHVRIITVAHCMQNTVTRMVYPMPDFFLGLGVSSQPEMTRLRWRADLINYSGTRDKEEILKQLTEHDEKERAGLLVMGDHAASSTQQRLKSLPAYLLALLLAPIRLLWYLVAATINFLCFGAICAVAGLTGVFMIWGLTKILGKAKFEFVNSSDDERQIRMAEQEVRSGTSGTRGFTDEELWTDFIVEYLYYGNT